MRNIEYVYDTGLNYIVFSGGDAPGCGVPKDSDDGKEITAYLADHPEALQPEPTPPAPTPEQLVASEIAEKLAYLQSTDWYVIRFADSGVPVPDDIKTARAEARARIDELKGMTI